MTGTPLDVLDETRAGEIAALCRRAMPDPPTEAELEACLFAPEQPATVRGDPSVGVVASTRWEDQGYVRLIAVDPSRRRQGHGRALLEAAEEDLAGLSSITVGADAPYYLYPGVQTTQTEMLCMLEHLRYQRGEANYNVSIDLDQIPADPGGTTVAGPDDRLEVEEWMKLHWPNWTLEALRALDKSSLVISRDSKGIASFCAYDVNRAGLLGPVATRAELIGHGAGVPVLLSALHRMRESGRKVIEVAWVGPLVPYARVGGKVSRVFFVYRKQLS